MSREFTPGIKPQDRGKHDRYGRADRRESGEEVERRTAQLTAEMRPRTEQGRTMLRRMAVNSYRIERSFLEESVTLSIQILKAQAEVDLLGIEDPYQARQAQRMAGTQALFDSRRAGVDV